MHPPEGKREGPPAPLYLVQLLRGVAAVSVVVYHCAGLIIQQTGSRSRYWASGAAGVDVFFVISGFVMALSAQSLVRRAAPAREFLRRRIERIVPLYWIFTTLKLVLLLLFPRLSVHPVGGSLHIIASYLFLPTGSPPLVIVGWTLNFEMMFYLLFAVCLALKLRPLLWLTPIFLLIGLAPLFVNIFQHGIYSDCNPIVFEFLFGGALFAFFQRHIVLPRWLAWTAAGAAVCVILSFPGAEPLLSRPIAWGLPALAIVAAALQLEPGLGHRVPAFLLKIGDASYTIYLAHSFIVPACFFLVGWMGISSRPALLLAVLLSVLACIAASLPIYRFVELPFIRFFKVRQLIKVSV